MRVHAGPGVEEASGAWARVVHLGPPVTGLPLSTSTFWMWEAWGQTGPLLHISAPPSDAAKPCRLPNGLLRGHDMILEPEGGQERAYQPNTLQPLVCHVGSQSHGESRSVLPLSLPQGRERERE